MSDLLYVNGLIDRALKTVRAVSNKQSSNEADKADTLDLLNEILADMNATGIMLPFQVMVSFELITGVRNYTIGNVPGASVVTTPFVDIEYIDIIIDGVRYSVVIQDDFAILGHDMSLVNQSRPGWVRITRSADVNTLEFYNLPDQDYLCQVWGKKETGDVGFQDHIQLANWYARYLRLALAREVNDYFNLKAWDQFQENKFLEAETKMLAAAKKDWSIKSTPPFAPGIGIRTFNLGVRT